MVLASAAKPPSINALTSLPEGVRLQGKGQPGGFAYIEATDSLCPPIAWEVLDVELIDFSGLFDFTDTDATNHAARFYRATAP